MNFENWFINKINVSMGGSPPFPIDQSHQSHYLIYHDSGIDCEKDQKTRL
jgi:hypothetical protein